ncbi:RibD family protein [Lachnospira pectinoschiza]|uniref:Pyrimidine reductase, riboflavin biosynthesis n=1 Tax=Lachnospira pectinoschiza TaxID=28052 RepID=A0A1H0A189_9FIRM|nr:dihydrofolate reductase family protein [Lachnospira pectinoschiza]SDN27310.1 Pyrimidine reductase, riboflavin biosynthesis [Lachnospira pectinoschiza]
MSKPFITCYMMTSIDGRIDCNMTTNLPGVEDYYPLLKELNFDSVVSGRTTAKLELAEAGEFMAKNSTAVGEETVSKKADSSNGYEVVVDSKGTLLWKNDSEYDRPRLIITSTQVSKEYLAYLDEKNISYIVAGSEKTDIVKASMIMADTFGIKRLGIVGGPTINTAFLDAGLLDEVILLVGAGVDGRASFPPVFNRSDEKDFSVTKLKLEEVKQYPSDAVLLRYSTKK